MCMCASLSTHTHTHTRTHTHTQIQMCVVVRYSYICIIHNVNKKKTWKILIYCQGLCIALVNVSTNTASKLSHIVINVLCKYCLVISACFICFLANGPKLLYKVVQYACSSLSVCPPAYICVWVCPCLSFCEFIFSKQYHNPNETQFTASSMLYLNSLFYSVPFTD